MREKKKICIGPAKKEKEFTGIRDTFLQALGMYIRGDERGL